MCKASYTWSEHEEAQHEEAGATGHTSAGNETSAVQWQIGKMKYTYLKFLWTLYLIFTTMQRKWSLNTLRMCSYFKATSHVKTVHFKSFKWFIIRLAHGGGWQL